MRIAMAGRRRNDSAIDSIAIGSGTLRFITNFLFPESVKSRIRQHVVRSMQAAQVLPSVETSLRSNEVSMRRRQR